MAVQIDIGKTRSGLYGLGRKMHSSIIRFLKPGPDRLDLKRTDAASFAAEFDAATTAEDEFQACRVMRSDGIAQRLLAEESADRFIGKVKGIVEDLPEFGTRWTMAWLPLGFKTPGTIETPSDLNDKLEVLRSISTWLARNPDQELTNATNPNLSITHQRADELEQALANAISKIDEFETKVGQCQGVRDAAEEAFKKRIRAVINELDFLLDPMDPRWVSFGLNKPGETLRPDQPQDVQVTATGPARLRFAWEPSARASRYKVRVLVVGRDQEFQTVAEVFEENAELTFEPTQTVRVEIIAVNGAGDSVPSQAVERQLVSVAA